jgi:hypothetical protein
MRQTPANHPADGHALCSGDMAQPRRRHLLTVGVLGIAIGIAATITAHAVATFMSDSPYSKTKPGASRWACEGAELLAVATLDDGIVMVHVTVRDGQKRTWSLARTVYSAPEILKPVGNGYQPVVIETGDLDGGSTRTVRLKPSGGDRWCRGSVSLT